MVKILIIEDDFYIRELYRKTFERAGYAVEVAMDGEQGVAMLKNGKYAIALLDIMMPKLNGIDVLKAVRAEDFPSKNVPIFLITNLGQNNIIDEAFKIGADGYFLKSQITPNEIISEIGGYLKKIGIETPEV